MWVTSEYFVTARDRIFKSQPYIYSHAYNNSNNTFISAYKSNNTHQTLATTTRSNFQLRRGHGGRS